MKTHGITRAVEDYNRLHGPVIMFFNSDTGEVFTRVYANPEQSKEDLALSWWTLFVKGEGGLREPNDTVTVKRVENEIAIHKFINTYPGFQV